MESTRSLQDSVELKNVSLHFLPSSFHVVHNNFNVFLIMSSTNHKGLSCTQKHRLVQEWEEVTKQLLKFRHYLKALNARQFQVGFHHVMII